MNFIDKVRKFLINIGAVKRPKISILIPFSTEDKIRRDNFGWLLRYWKRQLPNAEIIVGESNSRIFCKGEALNNAFERSNGKILAVLDADAYFDDPKVIERCADRILEAECHGHNLWFVPYRRLYRLASYITHQITHSYPCHPKRISDPPKDCDLDRSNQNALHYGHLYAAMAIVIPRKAMGHDFIKCWDEFFFGWGGEDISFLRAMDTIFGKHKTTDNAIFHLWHPFHGKTHRERTWDNQDMPNLYWKRASRYNHAYRKVHKMKELMHENYGYYQSRKNRE